MNRITILLILTCLSFTLQAQRSLTPALGWSSWNNYRIHINEELILKQADAMLNSGMKEVGYQYINIDDGYFGGRDNNGMLYCDSAKFPDGMKVIADYIHSKGLKAGIYSDAGTNTCGSIWDADTNGYGVGLWQHEFEDYHLFFQNWGYDFIKVDWCGGEKMGLDVKERYTYLIKSLRQSDDGVIFNICRWKFPGTWAIPISDSWRISGDINASFKSICHIIDLNTFLAPYAGSGHFNDMDMLQVGRGMSIEEDKSHMTMWCMLVSPLMAGNDLSTMSMETQTILTNAELIQINQDTAAIQAELKYRSDSVEMWVKPLATRYGLVKAVAILNRSSHTCKVPILWSKTGLQNILIMEDLWAKQTMNKDHIFDSIQIPAHGIRIFRVEAASKVIPDTYEAEYAFLNMAGQERSAFTEWNINASGGALVSNIGGYPKNWIEFQHVYVEEKGNYDIEVLCIGNQNPEFKFWVNGAEIQSHINVKLQKGENTIRVNNINQTLNGFDRLVLKQSPEINKSR